MKATQETANELAEYADKLLGLISPEKIRKVKIERVDPALIKRYEALEDVTSTVADILDELGIDSAIPGHEICSRSGGKMVGSAVTVRYVPARIASGFNIAHQQPSAALGGSDIVTLSQAGDVLVIESNCDQAVSSFGGIMATSVAAAGLAGLVVEGNVRDVANMRKLGLRVWSRGITPRTGKHRLELADFNGAVHIAGVQIRPGDLILADDDGIVVVPIALAETVINRAEAAASSEGLLIDAIARGDSPSDVVKIVPSHKW
ncbi:RraA family protein [Allopusillimonas ginsengisoli]|uniref:RraA family protein n=1 Tax=Allopusillimonas ginsengisoli TaxID=453575 RepID=UPI00101F9BC9|nr:RraA family protein [Allopusillimonas ginsengisoli]TEA79046.1 RraA family protein [Allopusillimonas ginsengisoli]